MLSNSSVIETKNIHNLTTTVTETVMFVLLSLFLSFSLSLSLSLSVGPLFEWGAGWRPESGDEGLYGAGEQHASHCWGKKHSYNWTCSGNEMGTSLRCIQGRFSNSKSIICQLFLFDSKTTDPRLKNSFFPLALSLPKPSVEVKMGKRQYMSYFYMIFYIQTPSASSVV